MDILVKALQLLGIDMLTEMLQSCSGVVSDY